MRQRQAVLEQAAAAQRRYQQAEMITAFQRELLPYGLPALPGTRIAASYLLADADTAAGGLVRRDPPRRGAGGLRMLRE